MAADLPPPGFTFAPPELELTDVYLRGKIAGRALPAAGAGFIRDVDVYSAEPEVLAKGSAHAPGTGAGEGSDAVADKQRVWYFFNPVRYAGGGRKIDARGGGGGGGGGRKARTVAGDGGKRWHPECSPKPVKGGSAIGGYEQKFSYMVKDAASGKDRRAGWIMAEYGISPEHGGGDLVLCKIYQSTRSGPGASSSTTASTAAVPVSESESSSGSKKRKAAGDHPEAPTPSARPRQVEEQDSHPLLLPESLEPALSPEDAVDLHRQTADEAPPPPIRELINAGDMSMMMEDFERLYRDLFTNEGTTAVVIDDGDQDMDWFEGDQGAPVAGAERDAAAGLVNHDHHLAEAEAPPSSFWRQMEEEFASSYQDVVVVSKNDGTLATEKDVDPLEGDLAAPPSAPAAETESAAAVAARLWQTMIEDNVPCRNDVEANASMGEEGAQGDESAADEVIYGLPCPEFSPAYYQQDTPDVRRPLLAADYSTSIHIADVGKLVAST